MRTNCSCCGRPLGTPKCSECLEEIERAAPRAADAMTCSAIAAKCREYGIEGVYASTQYGMGFLLSVGPVCQNNIMYRGDGLDHETRQRMAQRINAILRQNTLVLHLPNYQPTHTMFYGYESESKMREHNPTIADHLVSIAEHRPMVVCTRGKQCTGSIDGKEFMYADGSKDFGIKITDYCAKLHGNVFRWSLENAAEGGSSPRSLDGSQSSDTPETDAVLCRYDHPAWPGGREFTVNGKPVVLADFARKLERERDKARDAAKYAECYMRHHHGCRTQSPLSEATAARCDCGLIEIWREVRKGILPENDQVHVSNK